ncbi:hypothetical protein HEB94_003773 [Actinopolymorpha pittospori]|uniref:Uncharacterized protein n=1 Tax=Actinopolymorpha pittospori TaxID=648752 RepID=A0A927N1E6_9ACTN|nr:hypothetical protein [Actinopolymorpha pittospori]MBE1606925.1 hypothetical protein [Actinopolymorpha pittospori]
MRTQQRRQLRRARHGPAVADAPVFQLTTLAGLTVVGPRGARIWGRMIEVDLSPSDRRQVEVRHSEFDRLLGAEAGVVHRSEEGFSRGPLGFNSPTASSNAAAWAGFRTLRLSTVARAFEERAHVALTTSVYSDPGSEEV